ncbi:hypothetical protein OG607_33070 [Streptomyces sp. NBC_01537]|uniref:hypothetical protein n=1 Tax=Streptomyces sp. NBC_01537 TaxID=2903896 RepID=UPI003867A278
MGLGALLLVGSGAVCLGIEVGVGILLHVTQSVWVALLVYPGLYFLAVYLLFVMVPSIEEPKGWAILAVLVLPVSALVVMHVTYSGLDQRAMHARGREVRATVTDVYWVDQGADAPLFVAELTDLSGRLVPGKVYGAKVKVGQTVTVTVDPKGKIPLSLGGRPTGSGKLLVAGIAAGVEILLLAWAAFRGTADRLAAKTTHKPKRTQEPQDAPV